MATGLRLRGERTTSEFVEVYELTGTGLITVTPSLCEPQNLFSQTLDSLIGLPALFAGFPLHIIQTPLQRFSLSTLSTEHFVGFPLQIIQTPLQCLSLSAFSGKHDVAPDGSRAACDSGVGEHFGQGIQVDVPGKSREAAIILFGQCLRTWLGSPIPDGPAYTESNTANHKRQSRFTKKQPRQA